MPEKIVLRAVRRSELRARMLFYAFVNDCQPRRPVGLSAAAAAASDCASSGGGRPLLIDTIPHFAGKRMKKLRRDSEQIVKNFRQVISRPSAHRTVGFAEEGDDLGARTGLAHAENIAAGAAGDPILHRPEDGLVVI